MSNMFKSERRPTQYSDRDRLRSYNNDFKGVNEKKKVEVKLTEADFPDLVGNNNATVTGDCKLNFKEAYLKEVENVVPEEEPLPPGWTRYRIKNGVIIIDGEAREEENYTSEEYHYDATQSLNRLIYRWSEYKKEYDELHGDGAYNGLYGMPQYNSFNEEDCDEWQY